MNETLLWDLEETARQLGGVSTRTVRRLVQQREIAGVRVRSRVMVSPESVRAYLAQQITGSDNPARAGRDVRERSTCRKSARHGTWTVSTGERTRPTGGRPTWTRAARELDALLASGSQSRGGEKLKRS